MNERRRFRRSSPDAPQGAVAVLTVFAALVAVAVVAGVGFVGADAGPSAKDPHTSAVPKGDDGTTETSVGAPTTALIRGGTTTTLFVTTTTPITTTTSTTLPGPVLDAGGPEVVFGPGVTSVSFTVRSSSVDGVDFDVTDVPEGMSASPTHATVSETAPATITLRITDTARATGGTIVLVGSDGSRVPVKVTVQGDALTVASVTLDPDPPVCGQSVRLVVGVSGGAATTVSAVVDAANGRSTVSLTPIANGLWATTLSAGPTGSSLSGTVIVTDSTGKTAGRSFSTVVAGGPGC